MKPTKSLEQAKSDHYSVVRHDGKPGNYTVNNSYVEYCDSNDVPFVEIKHRSGNKNCAVALDLWGARFRLTEKAVEQLKAKVVALGYKDRFPNVMNSTDFHFSRVPVDKAISLAKLLFEFANVKENQVLVEHRLHRK